MKKNMLVEEFIIAILLCIMVFMVCAQVLSRYVLHKSLSHTEELVRYMFVWMTFLGVSVAAFRGKHLSVTLGTYIIPERFLAVIKKLYVLSAILLTVIIFWFGSRVVFLQLITGQTTAALGMPMWVIGLAVPVCAVVLLIRIVILVKNHI
ncbi:MAG: TRAP transporter small permease [Candidatus Latescibacteria bacterium]|nr:TRAP transporter small permease [Candidatus Latescibacterota bacterium]